MECKAPVKPKSNKLKELIEQLKDVYNEECSSSDVEKLRKFIDTEKLDGLDEKLITIFHFTFFGSFEVIDEYNKHFLSLLNNKPESIKGIIDEIFSKYTYGNHRKFCKKSYEYYGAAINSFLDLLPQLINDVKNEVSFDTLYNKISTKKISKKVYSFGRTATWDFLECIDRIILKGALYPTKMYLRYSTGPKNGVMYFFSVKDINELKGKLKDKFAAKSLKYNYEYLEEAGVEILDIIKKSDISDKTKKDKFLIYKIEDALCIFQKGKY